MAILGERFEQIKDLEVLIKSVQGCRIEDSCLHPRQDAASRLVNQGLILQQLRGHNYVSYITTEKGNQVIEEILDYTADLIRQTNG